MVHLLFDHLFFLLSGLWRVLPALVLLHSAAAGAIEGMPAPADGIFDDTRALGENARQALAAEIRSLTNDLKCDVWLTATSFPASGFSPRRQAQTTRIRWSGDKPSLLLGYDRATNSLIVSLSPDFWDRYPASSLANLGLQAGRVILNTRLSLEERLVTIVTQAARHLRELETVRLKQSVWLPKEEWQPSLMLAGVLAGGALLAAMAGIIARSRSRSRGDQLVFPEVSVSTRLGAPFGGGLIAEMRVEPPAR